MFNKIRTAALSAVIGLGALAALPATAQADSFYFGITPHGPSAGVIVDEGRSYHRPPSRWDRDRWDRDRRDRWDRGCSVGEALRKADRMGIYRARISRETRRSITVSGRSHGRYVAVSFAKVPSCPIVR
jgi:hypothetical protein